MIQYHYRAVSQIGRQKTGNMAAANEHDLYQRLRDVGLELVDCRDLTKGSEFRLRRRITARDKIQFCIEMAALQRAGISLLVAIEDIRDSVENASFKDALTQIYRDVSEGEALSVAFARHPKIFDRLFVSMIKAAEETGDYADIFERLAIYIGWQSDFKRKIIRAMRYPAFAFLAVLVAFVVLMKFSLPNIVSYLEDSGLALPDITLALISTTSFIGKYWLLLLIVPSLFIFGTMLLYRKNDDFAYMIDNITLRLPLIGRLKRKVALARYSQIFAMLYKAKIPILTCLKTASPLVNNRVLAGAFGVIHQDVQSGMSLSEAMAKTEEFPPLILRMVKVGEETGELDNTLTHISEFYGRDVDDAVANFTGALGPLLTIAVGICLIWIFLAILFPLYGGFSSMDTGW